MISTEPMPRSHHTAASSVWSGRGLAVSRISDTRSGASRDLSQGNVSRLWPRSCSGLPVVKHAARDLHFDERSRLRIQRDVERRVGARGLAQQFEVGDDAVGGGLRRHGLKVHRDLGADDIQSDDGARCRASAKFEATIYPTRSGQVVGDRGVLWPCAFNGPGISRLRLRINSLPSIACKNTKRRRAAGALSAMQTASSARRSPPASPHRR